MNTKGQAGLIAFLFLFLFGFLMYLLAIAPTMATLGAQAESQGIGGIEGFVITHINLIGILFAIIGVIVWWSLSNGQ